MRQVALAAVVRYCERQLQTARFTDWAGAVNGLQVENRGRVRRVAAAVDARRATIERAAEAGADLLLVHHGLFWGTTVPWTGPRYDLLRLLLEHDLAVYSSHLPLDAHPKLGNNAQLCRRLGLRNLRPFFEHEGQPIGFVSETRMSLGALGKRLAGATGETPRIIAGGRAICRRIGVVSGAAGSELRKAAAAGVDTLVTGEGPHWSHALAEELGLNVLYGGHYATETFGVRALAEQLASKFGLPWVFVDYPTGL